MVVDHQLAVTFVLHAVGAQHAKLVRNLGVPCCLTLHCSGLMTSPAYTALLGLAAHGACNQGGAGDGLLAGLSSAMQTHLLR
jgi:hypothetical protein